MKIEISKNFLRDSENAHWCYVLMRHRDKMKDSKINTYYQIHELHWEGDFNEAVKDKKGAKKHILGCTTDAITPCGDTKEDILEEIQMMSRDIKFYPVFDYDTCLPIKKSFKKIPKSIKDKKPIREVAKYVKSVVESMTGETK